MFLTAAAATVQEAAAAAARYPAWSLLCQHFTHSTLKQSHRAVIETFCIQSGFSNLRCQPAQSEKWRCCLANSDFLLQTWLFQLFSDDRLLTSSQN